METAVQSTGTAEACVEQMRNFKFNGHFKELTHCVLKQENKQAPCRPKLKHLTSASRDVSYS